MAVIFYSPASPYSTKVRMAALWCKFAVEEKLVDANAEPSDLFAVNPLGKIPTLVTDDGDSVYDSRVITQYLNRVSGNALFPRNAAKRLEVERLEALGDGICDCLVTHVYERRFRPEEKVHQPWLDRQWSKVARALDLLNEKTPRVTTRTDGGQIALRAAIGYLDLRFSDSDWRRGRAKLARWVKRFDERFPELVALIPRA